MCTIGYTNHRYSTYQKQRNTNNGCKSYRTALGTNTTLVVTLLSDTNCVSLGRGFLVGSPLRVSL